MYIHSLHTHIQTYVHVLMCKRLNTDVRVRLQWEYHTTRCEECSCVSFLQDSDRVGVLVFHRPYRGAAMYSMGKDLPIKQDKAFMSPWSANGSL